MNTPTQPPLHRPFRTIAVVGGAGPIATMRFMQSLLGSLSARTGQHADAAFPRLLIDTTPVPGMDEWGLDDPEAASQHLQSWASQAQVLGADLIVVACLSLHRVLPLQNILLPPQFSVLHAALQALDDPAVLHPTSRHVKVLEADRGGAGLLAQALAQRGFAISPLTPEEHILKDKLIALGMQGAAPDVVSRCVADLEEIWHAETPPPALPGTGSIVPPAFPLVVLGCSELHLLPLTVPHVDAFSLALPALCAFAEEPLSVIN